MTVNTLTVHVNSPRTLKVIGQMLTTNEGLRYDRQIMIKEVGRKGQAKLTEAKVLVAGAGGLVEKEFFAFHLIRSLSRWLISAAAF